MQTHLFSAANPEQKLRHRTAPSYVCWSRMQAEAGQELNSILFRKEIERRAGGGIFFWGVGNAPSTSIGALARMNENVRVIFSIMKSRPKPLDSAPASVLVWRRFVDLHGIERDLPSHTLITSRGSSGEGNRKTRHYALMCRSEESLEIKRGIPFDHKAYRNVGSKGGPVGASQVTALLTNVSQASNDPDYEVNLEARLVGSYWVRLLDPIELSSDQKASFSHTTPDTTSKWMDMVASLREGPTKTRDDLPPSLF